MKIILGVCGFGLGHSIRQRPILEGLLARGHRVILIANDQSYQFYAQNYPQVPLLRVYVPVMHTTPQGLDFARTARDPHNNIPEANPAFWNACGAIEQAFGKPDIVISDYDMVSAQVAYLFGVPLITLDQQSKFLGYEFPTVGDFNSDEHRMRLGYFFPKARARIATSFFKVNYKPVEEYPVTIIPPIIGQDVKATKPNPIRRQVTLYVSEASQLQQSVAELAAVFSAFPEYQFFCFANGPAVQLSPNVMSVPNSRSVFLDTLAHSSAVIGTAGHNLITEALYLRVPMFLLPFDNYEQQLNAHIIAQERVGVTAATLTREALRQFLDSLDAYRSQTSAIIYDQFDGDTVFFDFLETLSIERL
jgi:uncharacterized protein (TIGR00661 family)